jgi:hypothetical protein
VILNAHDGAAFPDETESKNPVSNIQPGVSCGTAQEKPPKVLLEIQSNEGFCLSCLDVGDISYLFFFWFNLFVEQD